MAEHACCQWSDSLLHIHTHCLHVRTWWHNIIPAHHICHKVHHIYTLHLTCTVVATCHLAEVVILCCCHHCICTTFCERLGTSFPSILVDCIRFATATSLHSPNTYPLHQQFAHSIIDWRRAPLCASPLIIWSQETLRPDHELSPCPPPPPVWIT